MKYSTLLSRFHSTAWAMLPSKLVEIRLFLESQSRGEKKTRAEVKAATRKQAKARSPASVAVLPIFGVLTQRCPAIEEMSGCSGTDRLGRQLDSLVASADIKTIVLNIDSPGGSVYGVAELGDKIAAAAAQKKVIAISNSQAASGAYWLASQASEFCCTPGGEVGSIGVYTAHEDDSKALEGLGVQMTLVSAGKFKVEGNPYQPLSEDGRQAMQDQVDRYYSMFIGAVAKGRGVSVGKVQKDFGQGRMLGATDAKAAGMIDRVCSLDELMARLGVPAAAPAAAASPRNLVALRQKLAESE